MARIAVAAALLVVPIAFTACGERYRYTERKIGSVTQIVRIDRMTGRAEVMVRDRDGTQSWEPVLEQSDLKRLTEQRLAAKRLQEKADIAAAEEDRRRSVLREPRILQAKEWFGKLSIAPTFEVVHWRGDTPVYRIALRLTNRSNWTITELSADGKRKVGPPLRLRFMGGATPPGTSALTLRTEPFEEAAEIVGVTIAEVIGRVPDEVVGTPAETVASAPSDEKNPYSHLLRQ